MSLHILAAAEGVLQLMCQSKVRASLYSSATTQALLVTDAQNHPWQVILSSSETMLCYQVRAKDNAQTAELSVIQRAKECQSMHGTGDQC